MKKLCGIIAVTIFALLAFRASPLSAQTITPNTPSHERPVTGEKEYDFSKRNEKKPENPSVSGDNLMSYILISLPVVVLVAVVLFLVTKRKSNMSS